jgi:hypothetical protein
MMKDGFDSIVASWMLLPEALPHIGFYRIENMLKTSIGIKNIGAIECLNQKQI